MLSKPKNIFLIDDDPICNFLHNNLINSNFTAFNVTSFSEATHFLEFLIDNVDKPETFPHFILLDINMPEMNGWEFLDEYDKLKMPALKNSNIIMVTSSNNEADVEKAKIYKFIKGYYLKPLNAEKLAEILDK